MVAFLNHSIYPETKQNPYLVPDHNLSLIGKHVQQKINDCQEGKKSNYHPITSQIVPISKQMIVFESEPEC